MMMEHLSIWCNVMGYNSHHNTLAIKSLTEVQSLNPNGTIIGISQLFHRRSTPFLTPSWHYHLLSHHFWMSNNFYLLYNHVVITTAAAYMGKYEFSNFWENNRCKIMHYWQWSLPNPLYAHLLPMILWNIPLTSAVLLQWAWNWKQLG